MERAETETQTAVKRGRGVERGMNRVVSRVTRLCRVWQNARGETALHFSTLKMGGTMGHTKCRTLLQPLAAAAR